MKLTVSLKTLMLAAALALLTGCASVVPMAPKDQDSTSKTFKAPAPNMAGVYIYREDSNFGKALTKTLSIDGVAIGESAPGVYFHREVTQGEHTLATQAEFGENTVKLNAEAGKNYFFQQFMKWGTFKGSAGIQAVTEEVGKQNVLKCNEAK
jgi:hypothetical protein